MKMVLLGAVAFGAGFLTGVSMCGRTETLPGELRVLTRVDTVCITSPPRVSVRYLRADTVYLPSAESVDSVRALVPVEQAEYSGEGYRAYVSGYSPRLDSLVMVRRVNLRNVRRASRFSIGLQAGYGITPRGFQPYLGVGLSYTISTGR